MEKQKFIDSIEQCLSTIAWEDFESEKIVGKTIKSDKGNVVLNISVSESDADASQKQFVGSLGAEKDYIYSHPYSQKGLQTMKQKMIKQIRLFLFEENSEGDEN